MKRCACPCGQPVDPTSKSKYATPSTCRPRYFKLKHATEGLTPRERKLITDRAKKAQARLIARAGSRTVPSDDRISYRKALVAVADYISSSVPDCVDRRMAEDEARDILKAARPQR